MDGIVGLPELERPVRVYFDQRAIPYIQASSKVDLNLAQGYVTASERIFQMDMLRRMAKGELSEIFGSACLPQDKLARTLGFTRLAKKDYGLLSNETRSLLKAYCLGVNAYINQNSNRLPIQFFALAYRPRLWQPEDSLAILKFLEYQVDESWRLDEFRNRIINKAGGKLASRMFEQNLQSHEVKTSMLDLPGFKPLLQPQAKHANLGFGSNAWTVSSAISNSGGCLIACDKHTFFSAPDLFYVCSLRALNTHVAGATIPGVPGIIMGRNDDIAWAMTALKADVQDLYIEQFSDKYPLKYRIPGGWSDAVAITEEIPQRFAGNLLTKILETRHGPILIKSDNTGVALSWTGFHTKRSSLETIFQLNQMSNPAEFRKILEGYEGSPQTFLYADRVGNTGMQVAGAIPVRKCDRKINNYLFTDGPVILPGWNDDCAWIDKLKFADLPSQWNTAEGFLVASDPRNPFITTSNSDIAAQRIVAVLQAYKKNAQHLDLPEMSSLQGDQSAYLESLVKAEIASALRQVQTADKFQFQALSALTKWDGQLHPESGPACIYESFLVTFLRRVLDAKIGRELVNEYVQRWPRWSIFVARALRDKPAELLPPGERSYTTLILTSFSESLKNLRMTMKSDDPQSWSWKRLHKIDFLESSKSLGVASSVAPVIMPGPLGVGGDQDCVNACNIEVSHTPWLLQATCGPSERLVIDMSDRDKFYQNLTLGQSEHLLSSYRTDQLRSWLNVEPHAVAFSDKQVKLQMQHTLVLSNTYQ